MSRRHRPGPRPSVHRLEGRELLSATTNLLVGPGRTARGAIDGAWDGRGGAAARQETPPNPLLFPSGVPTPRQQARQTLVARFEGTFAVGPGRFSSEAREIYLRGAGGSNQFLHGDTQLRVITPADPSRPLG